MKEFPRKFLSLRDKNGSHRRSKSGPPHGNKSRPLAAEAFMSIFKADHAKSHHKEGSDAETDDAKIAEIQRRLDRLNITGVTVDHIRDIMVTRFAEGDPRRTAEFIDMEQKATSGQIVSYDPSVEMVGAENRGAVTCYLDALLFAMFAKMDAFECILKNDFPPDDHRIKLVNLLRIWVNMLRTGKLIRTDMTKLIQDALADCGWSDARMLEQQDTSEAFAFITETLQLPLLSLQVDLFHQGHRDEDDHKVVYERLLNLAIPPDPEGKGIKLEDCLEEYFNAQVDVLRDSEVARKPGEERRPTVVHRNTLRLVTESHGEASTAVTASPIAISPGQPEPIVEENAHQASSPTTQSESQQTVDSSPQLDHCATPTQDAIPPSPMTVIAATEGNADEKPAITERRPTPRHRSTSVIQHVVLDGKGRSSSISSDSMLQKARRKGSTVVKAVTIPAWQFFRLIPWHALASNEPQNDIDVAMNFEQRPVVGICLKRYAMTESGLPQRHNTFIDIPDSLRLPHFMLADDKSEDNTTGLNTEYKLVLQSVICHRGDSLYSGHYISFARVAPKLLTDNRRHDFDPPPDYEEAQWVRFDDLDIDNRVTYVDDIRQSLRDEMPYLLFYQVVPMVEVAAPPSEGTAADPPSYIESRNSLELPPTPGGTENTLPGPGYFDSTPTARQSKPPSIRLSLEDDRQPRKSTDGVTQSYSGSTLGDSRRQSINHTDSTSVTPAITPESHSPALTPGDESTASRLSRAASKFKATRSRPVSQSGEGRISMTMTRLGGLMKANSNAGKDATLLEPSVLNISTNSIASGSEHITLGDAVSVDGEMPHHSAQNNVYQKHGHKRGKSKEKVTKLKAGSQPERECVVM